jgi:CrcB protein
MNRLLLVCLGGAAGSGARYLLATWVTAKAGGGFPFGTLAVNVIGSFAMGFLAKYAAAHETSETTRIFLATGVLGGFTTYSAFNEETLRFVQLGAWGPAAMNVGATVAACLAAGFAGFAAARAAG